MNNFIKKETEGDMKKRVPLYRNTLQSNNRGILNIFPFYKQGKLRRSRTIIRGICVLFLVVVSVLADQITITLKDKHSDTIIQNGEITVYKINEDGSKSWFKRGYTNENGNVQFTLEGVENGVRYILGSKHYNGYRSYSQELTSAASHVFYIGETYISIKNGNDPNHPPYDNKKVYIYTIDEGGKNTYFSHATTDENGDLKLNLPNKKFIIKAKSLLSGQYKLSGVVENYGKTEFIVGNIPLVITIKDPLTGTIFPDSKVTVYKVENDGTHTWYTHGYTNETGVVSFDLEGLGVGTPYFLKTKQFNQYFTSSQINITGDFTFNVGTSMITVMDGNKEKPVPLSNHKVHVHKVLGDGSTKWYSSGFTDGNGQFRTNLKEEGNQVSYRVFSNSVFGNLKYSMDLQQHGNIKFIVGTVPLTVTLKNGRDNSILSHKNIIIRKEKDDGVFHWYKKISLDENGTITIELPELGKSIRYTLATKAFENVNIYSYSEPLTTTGNYTFSVGNVHTTIIDPTLNPVGAYKNKKVWVYRIKEGRREYFGDGYTDENGIIQMDLPNFLEGKKYVIGAKNTISGKMKYSNEITKNGNYTFTVGNTPLTVVLKDALTSTVLADKSVTLYKIKDDGGYTWYRQKNSDENGIVRFDVDELGEGTKFILRSKIYNNVYSYSNPISSTGEFVFKVGTTTITLLNGNNSPSTPLSNHKMYVYRNETDGTLKYISSMYSDSNGVIKLNLLGMENGITYTIKSKSIIGNREYSKTISSDGSYEFTVGIAPVNIHLVDAISHTAISGKYVTIDREQEDGSFKWYKGVTTDIFGKSSVELPGVTTGEYRYRMRVKAFNDKGFRSYSSLITISGDYLFEVGSLKIIALDGTTQDNLPYKNKKIYVYKKISDTEKKYVTSGYTDSMGIARLDLPEIDNGVAYILKGTSSISNQSKYSDEITSKGEHTFKVGNLPVNVSLFNALTGDKIVDQKITVYEKLSDESFKWQTSGETDSNGLVRFDLDGLNEGRQYRLKTNVYSSGSSYSKIITTNGDFPFAVGAVPVQLIDNSDGRFIANKKITAYRITNENKLTWMRSGNTNENGSITFDLIGLGDGERFVFKASSPFGEGKSYYGPVITDKGEVAFRVTKGAYGGLDLISPTVTIISPESDIANSTGFTLTGNATDNTVVSEVRITVTDPVKGIQQGIGILDRENGLWSFSVLGQWITNGENITITVDAIDAALNRGRITKQYKVTSDQSAPIISIESHQNNDTVNVTGFSIFGTVTDDIQVESITATLVDPVLGATIDNILLDISSENGQWALPVTNGKVSLNSNSTITLNATDINGNSSQTVLNVYVGEVVSSAAHIVHRITFGMTPELMQRAQSNEDILTEQMSPENIDDSEFENQMASMAVSDLNSLKEYLLTYMIGSKKQLREVMTWFWENHFNTSFRTHENPQYELAENNLFRQHALGNFRDLLEASAKSPAMINYLNSNQNVVGRPNENYAREIMELHTVGIDGGYTEEDVAELARVFTGWHEQNGVFTFNNSQHDTGDKTVMGLAIAGSNDGVSEGEMVISFLATHPSTAEYISKKLITYFVSDENHDQLLQQCKAEYLATNGDIKSVLTVIFGSEEFSATSTYLGKIKTPLELVTSVVRGFNGTMNANSVNTRLREMGMPLFEYPVPTGFSEVGTDWINSNALLQRFALVNQAVWVPSRGISIKGRDLMVSEGYTSAEAIISYLFEISSGGEFTELEYQTALAILNDGSNFDINAEDTNEKINRLIGTVLSFPGFQFQ